MVDGGVNLDNINKINAESVTSASAIIKSDNSIKDILKLKQELKKIMFNLDKKLKIKVSSLILKNLSEIDEVISIL